MKIPDFIPDIVLELRKDGTFVDGNQVEVAALLNLFKGFATAGKQRLKVVADEATNYRHVKRVLDTAREEGLFETEFSTRH